MIIEAINPHEFYHAIRAGLEEAIKNSGEYVSIGQVFDALNNDTWKLYIIMNDNDGEYIGFGIVETLHTANGSWLSIPFAYAKNGSYNEFFLFLSEIAHKLGMNGVKFISSRNGFERRAKQFGWKKGFIEWIVSDFRGKQ